MYIALKPCSFAGEAYRIGEEIPNGKVLPEAVARLVRQGVIAENGPGVLLPGSASLEKIVVPILTDEGQIDLEVTPEALKKALRVAQMPEDTAIDALKELQEEDELIIVHALTKSDRVKDEIYDMAPPEEIPEEEPAVTIDALMKKTRDELVKQAEALNIEVKDEDTKKVIAAAIVEAEAATGSDN